MHSYNFFTEYQHNPGEKSFLEKEEFIHCCRVLRHREGDEISLIDGHGGSYAAVIESVQKNRAEFRILEKTVVQRSEPFIRLGVGIVRNKAMEQIAAGVAALGIAEIIPLQTENSIKESVPAEKLFRKVIEAGKQSGNLFFTAVQQPLSLNDWFAVNRGAGLKMIGLQHGTKRIRDIRTETAPQLIALMIGPESGFTDEEITASMAAGFEPVTVSRHRLRTEMAAVALSAAVLTIL